MMSGAYPQEAEAPLPSRTAARVRVPLVLECQAMIFALKALLTIGGFASATKWIRRQVEGVPELTEVGAEAVKATEYAVAMAAAFYPGRALCLEQSLVLYYLLRRQGVAVKYCQGIQAYPFAAHAWIEYRGKPINDFPEHVRHFVRLPDQLP